MSTLSKIVIGWFIAGLFVGWVCFDARLSRLGDNAEFIVISTSIASGQGISYVHGVSPEPARKFPPGYPALLAVLQWISPSNIYAMKGVTVLFFGLMIPLVWLIVREVDSSTMASCVTVAALVSPQLVEYSHQVLSEIPYGAVSLAALLVLLKFRESSSPVHLAALISLAVCSYYLRTIGLTVIGASVLTYATGRQFKQAALVGGVSGLIVLPWFVTSTTYLSQVSSANPYFTEEGGATVTGLATRVWTNLELYGTQFLPNGLLPFYDFRVAEGAGATLLAILSSLLFVYFVVRITRPSHGAFPVGLYLSLYCGILLLWPSVWTDTRFMVPIIPFALYGAMWSARDIADRVLNTKDARSYAWGGAVVIIILANGSRTAATQIDHPPWHIAWSDYFRTASWISTHTPPDALIACRKPFLMHVMSGRRTMAFPFIDPEPLTRSLKEAGVDYVVTDVIFSQTVDYLNPAIVQHPATFHPVNKFPASNTMVFELLSDADGRDPLAYKRKSLEAALARNPADRTLWRQLMSVAVSYHQQGNLDKALEIYEPVSRSLRQPDVFHNLGIAYFARQRFEESASAFLEAVKLNGADSGARLGLAQAYANLGDFENGLTQAREAMRFAPESAAAAQTLARCAMALQNWSEAERGLQKAIRIEPESVPHKAKLAELYVMTQRYTEAETILGGLIQTHTDHPELRLPLIQALTRTGKTDAALLQVNYLGKHHPEVFNMPLDASTQSVLEELAKTTGSTVVDMIQSAADG